MYFFFPRDTQVGIMIAFLLALVLEDVEKPYGGWRWVIAAQQMGRVQKTGWRAEFFESPAFFWIGEKHSEKWVEIQKLSPRWWSFYVIFPRWWLMIVIFKYQFFCHVW